MISMKSMKLRNWHIKRHALRGDFIFEVAKVGEKGQIVIPKKAREMLGVDSGDSVVVIGGKCHHKGLILINSKEMRGMAEKLMEEIDA
ncbi:MAG: AbrB/MazE/SpoVT family DNA-binding domain-containing protein [Candidatus Nomurabacteria bacterium]|jgi:AbrB family looped-hinge helix DNA binding protein|nr:AbrB/MazE/SpoVT family DNA-binding domain-containing protein [Candidatus Nomurabacteria bacterium]